MFTLREEQLDWEIVKHWCPGEGKDYDFSYDVMLKRRDYSTQGGVVVEYTGQPYDVWINYVVKGRELLIYSRRWKAKHNELGFKKIFSLDWDRTGFSAKAPSVLGFLDSSSSLCHRWRRLLLRRFGAMVIVSPEISLRFAISRKMG
jgi:hypothetical protein